MGSEMCIRDSLQSVSPHPSSQPDTESRKIPADKTDSDTTVWNADRDGPKKGSRRMARSRALSCTRGSHRTIAHWTFEGIKAGRAPRLSRRLSSVTARRASPLDSALRVDLETTLGHRQLHPDASHMRRVSPPRVSLYSMLGCELKKARSAPAASSTHAVLVPLGWPEDDSQCKIGKTSRGAV